MIDPVAFGARTVPRSVLRPLACSLVLVALFAAPALAGAGTLSPDDEQLASGEYFDRVTFSGAAGDEVRVEHSSREFQPYLLIRDPDGECVAESLPDVSYQARAWALVNCGGQEICMRLGMESDSDYNAFSAAGGVVRNCRMQLTGAIGDMQSAVDGHFG